MKITKNCSKLVFYKKWARQESRRHLDRRPAGQIPKKPQNHPLVDIILVFNILTKIKKTQKKIKLTNNLFE